MIVDTSAILAVLFNEKCSGKIAKILNQNASALRMSTVNLSEILILLQDRQPQLFDKLRDQLLCSSLRFVAPTVEHAQIAAEARMQFPLNLGDCFAYALAKSEQVPILTLDNDFRKTDINIVSLD